MMRLALVRVTMMLALLTFGSFALSQDPGGENCPGQWHDDLVAMRNNATAAFAEVEAEWMMVDATKTGVATDHNGLYDAIQAAIQANIESLGAEPYTQEQIDCALNQFEYAIPDYNAGKAWSEQADNRLTAVSEIIAVGIYHIELYCAMTAVDGDTPGSLIHRNEAIKQLATARFVLDDIPSDLAAANACFTAAQDHITAGHECLNIPSSPPPFPFPFPLP